jgi:hypothetical protein
MNTGRFREMGSKPGARQPVVTLLLTLLFVIAFNPAHAESTNVEAIGTRAAATAHLDFKIVIPKVLQMTASTGTIFTNAHRTETVVIATSETDVHRAIASRSDPSSIRSAIDALTRDAGRNLSGYTVAMP